MYDSNAKHSHGRGWAINRIIERLRVPPSQATIILLAGEDHDRQWLIRRDFLNHNIVSIDRDADSVGRVRRNGGIAVHGRVQDVLRCWPDDWTVHGLSLDFNCGFDEPVCLALSALLAKPFRSAAVYLNLQRGRDWYGRLISDGRPTWSTKNRADVALASWVHAHIIGAPDVAQFSIDQLGELFKILYSELKIELATPYRQKQGGVLMDGCVFNVPDETWGHSIKSTDQSITRKVIAARAVSTRFRKSAPCQ